MKKNYKLKLFAALVVVGVSIGSTKAFNPNPTSTTIMAKNPDAWVEIKKKNGIKVYFLISEENGNSYLNIKFENVKAISGEVIWSLHNGSNVIVDKSDITEIQTTDFITKKIRINEESLEDFSITIGFK